MFDPAASHTRHVQHLVGVVVKMSWANSLVLPRATVIPQSRFMNVNTTMNNFVNSSLKFVLRMLNCDFTLVDLVFVFKAAVTFFSPNQTLLKNIMYIKCTYHHCHVMWFSVHWQVLLLSLCYKRMWDSPPGCGTGLHPSVLPCRT